MTDYYVNKSGNDGNSGADAANAKLTVAAGIPLCTSGDTLHVGSGTYLEHDIIINNGVQGVTLEGDRYVTIDAEGGKVFTAFFAGGASALYAYFVVKNIRFRNYTEALSWRIRGKQTMFWAEGCYFDGGIYCLVAWTDTNAYATSKLTMKNCVVNGAGSAFYSGSNSECDVYMDGNLFYNITNEVFFGNGNSDLDQVKGNVFHTILGANGLYNGIAGAQVGGNISDWVDNYYYGFTGNFISENGTAYADLAAWKTANPGYEAGSKEGVDPLLVDPGNGILYPQAGSPVVGSGAIVSQIGPWSRVVNFCDTHQFSGDWDVQAAPATDAGTKWARTSGGVTLVGIKFEGQGVIVSPVWDMGGIYEIKKFMGTFSETYPTAVIDYDKSDTQPNRKNIRYKVSDTAFFQNDSGLSWVTHELNESLTAITGRFIQVELTFRTDGVAA